MSGGEVSSGHAREVSGLRAGAAARRLFNWRRALNPHVVIFSLTTILVLVTASEFNGITDFNSLLYGFALWGWWGIIASLLWRLGRRNPAILRFSPLVIVLQELAGCVLGTLHYLVLETLYYHCNGMPTNRSFFSIWFGNFRINNLGLAMMIYGFIFGVTSLHQYQARAQQDKVKSLELQRELSTAHLRALQMQLEPHFLFNTLNAVTTLVELGRQKEAVEMLSYLNAILKSTLKRTTPEKVPLSQELELVENYLAIEQVRFADRLRIEIKVEPGALEGLVPCFLLQPIVENAIRHGIARCEAGGKVEASAKREGEKLRLCVRDSGAGCPAEAPNGHGIGLNNTRERLTHFYGEAYAMKAEPLEAGGFEVAIAIPYERGEG
jgi:sensor histidine kinase YesM